MLLTIDQARLLRSLQLVERAVNDRSAMPILANVLLETTEKELVITATDLDVGMKYRLPLLQPGKQGAIALPARRLTTIVRELPNEVIVLEAKKNHTATVSCGSSHFRLPGLPAEDFPMFPPIEPRHTLSIPQALLKTLVETTTFAMSLEETRFILNGTLLQVQQGTVTLAATDGRRLAVATARDVEGADWNTRVVVPAKTIRELGRVLQDGEGIVRVTMLSDNQLAFQLEEVTVVSRLLEGQFPEYERVIPPPVATSLTCNRDALANAIRRVSLMTTAASQAVVFELTADRLVVSKESAELGSAREELPVRYTGQPMSVAFNPEFWLDVLKVMEADEVTAEIASPDKPAMIRLPNLLYLVLPMKLA
ncbi:MAG: DNA polymerase III subunit beta [Candidatus Omnitrophica bacterium]|nr:DNA polymerase III subunit beta [Candidatus Omnitrophota bacterium]